MANLKLLSNINFNIFFYLHKDVLTMSKMPFR